MSSRKEIGRKHVASCTMPRRSCSSRNTARPSHGLAKAFTPPTKCVMQRGSSVQPSHSRCRGNQPAGKRRPFRFPKLLTVGIQDTVKEHAAIGTRAFTTGQLEGTVDSCI